MTEPKSESIKEIADYLEVKYKIGLLWKNFTRRTTTQFTTRNYGND
jgi:hypothetical protein